MAGSEKNWLHYVRGHLPSLGTNPERAVEIEEELAQQMEDFYWELRRRGMSAEEATKLTEAQIPAWDVLARELRLANRPIGEYVWRGHREMEELIRKKGRWIMLADFLNDLGHAFKTFARDRSFSILAIAALAIGIGATTTVFSIFNAVLTPLPFPEPDQLVMVRDGRVDFNTPASLPEYRDWNENNQNFEGLGAYFNFSASLTGEGQPEELWGIRATANVLPLLGVQPLIGRHFTPEEEVVGKDDVALITYGLWQRKFGGDPDVIGRTVNLRNGPTTLIGVLPPDYKGILPADLRGDRPRELVFPLGLDADVGRGAHFLRVLGRLRPDVSLDQAREDMDRLALQLNEEGVTDHGILVRSLEEYVVGDTRFAILVMFAAVGSVLLIACANVANLLLTRATASQRQTAIRIAMGAGRGRLIRQFMTESAVLGLISGLAGLALTVWGIRVINVLARPWLPLLEDVSINGPVLAFTIGISLLTGLIFGTAPAVLGSRVEVGNALKEGGRDNTKGARTRKLRNALVVSEVALSLVLLIGSGLLIRSFVGLLAVDKGFAAERVVNLDVNIGSRQTDRAQQIQFARSILRRLRALPGVESAGVGSDLPLDDNDTDGTVSVEGRSYPPGGQPTAHKRMADEDYFRVIGIPLRKGRYFTEFDTDEAPDVVIVDEAFAEAIFPGEDPLGKRVGFDWGTQSEFQEIVGVVGDIREQALDQQPEPTIYVPVMQRPITNLALVMRTSIEPGALISTARQEVYALDPSQPVSRVRLLDDIVSESVAGDRLITFLLGGFALIALLLASVGIYGVLSYSVSQRTHEIGVRMALGAGRSDVLRHILREGMILAMAGIVLGLVGAFGLTRFLESLLYGIPPTDTLVYATISVLLGAVAFLACRVPAGRATRVDPMVALRHE